MRNFTNWSNDSKLIVIVNILKKHHLHLVALSFLLFYKPLIHNQVDYASSELHDNTQRQEILPPTKTYCSFNKDFAGLLILMQCINELYLYTVTLMWVCPQLSFQNPRHITKWSNMITHLWTTIFCAGIVVYPRLFQVYCPTEINDTTRCTRIRLHWGPLWGGGIRECFVDSPHKRSRNVDLWCYLSCLICEFTTLTHRTPKLGNCWGSHQSGQYRVVKKHQHIWRCSHLCIRWRLSHSLALFAVLLLQIHWYELRLKYNAA